jgi:hypothetical protein
MIQQIQQHRMIADANISRGEKVDEIQSLTTEISRLSHSVDWWNSAIIVMMVVAALAATGLVVTQYIAVRKAQRLSAAQVQLDAAKDAQLKIDLHVKDGEIADAKKAAGEANKTAEDERLSRLKLEARIADRRLSIDQRSAIRGQLRAFPRKVVQITLINPNGEMEAFSQDLFDALSKIDGWVVAIDSLTMSDGLSGVHIIVGPNATDADKKFADALSAAIRSVGIFVTGPRPPRPFTGPALEGGSRPNSGTVMPKQNVTIVIGKKP